MSCGEWMGSRASRLPQLTLNAISSTRRRDLQLPLPHLRLPTAFISQKKRALIPFRLPVLSPPISSRVSYFLVQLNAVLVSLVNHFWLRDELAIV